VRAYEQVRSLTDDLAAARELGQEDAAFAAEVPELAAELDQASERLRRLLVPRDPDDDRDAIVEVKAGEGGEESALFAGDLLRMYLRYAERRGWTTRGAGRHESDLGRLQGRAPGRQAPRARPSRARPRGRG
jgi:peptide chain release factor 1